MERNIVMRKVFGSIMVLIIIAAIFGGLPKPVADATGLPGDYPVAVSGFSATSGDPNPAVSAGWHHTVGLCGNGTVVAVGYNYSGSGQCNVGDWTSIVQISAGWFHTVGLKSDGTVVAVGDDSKYGTNGGNNTWQQTLFGPCDVGNEDWTNIVQVAAGGYATLGLKDNGTVVCAGGKAPEQNRPENNPYDNSTYPWNVGNWTNIVQVAAGGYHNVGLKSDGTVVAVGYHGYGECDVESWTDIVQVAAGLAHTVGLKSDGTVVAVGDNNSGECNVGTWSHIVQVAAGHNYTVGLKDDGTVVEVGYNYPYPGSGQWNVENWSHIVQVAAGYDHMVGLESDGTVVAVGDNNSGECNVENWNLVAAPSVVTTSASSVGTTSATLNGNITATGGGNASSFAFVWDTSSHAAPSGAPAGDYANSWISDAGSYDIGAYNSDINVTGLSPGITYYFRFGGNNTAGWSWGNEGNFTTAVTTLSVVTTSASNVGTTSATLNGNITATGGGNASSYAFVWDTSSHAAPSGAPAGDYGNSWTSDPGSYDIGAYNSDSNVTDLSPGTLYYFRFGTFNAAGWSWGEEGNFTTTIQIQISLKAGWNMVSVPVIPADSSVSAVFPGVAAVFTWDPVGKTYIMPTSVTPDTGYWVAVIGNTTIPVTGVPVVTWTSPLKAGWNMIGSVINNASIANPSDIPDASVQSFAYWWDPVGKTYALTTGIEPGKGYWVASVQDCVLTMP